MEFTLSIIFGSLIGFFLGFFGSGGSILAVPFLVYGLNIEPKSAIAMSLVIVGVSALAGTYQQARQKKICYKAGLFFGISGIILSYTSAKLSVFISGTTQLTLFAAIMIVSAIAMLKTKNIRESKGDAVCQLKPLYAVSLGSVVGAMKGLVGVGGGFLIVPALSTFGHLNLHVAMGTSLFIISLTTVSGIIGYLGVVEFNIPIMILFILSSIITTMIGAKVNQRVPSKKLKKGFAFFVLTLGALILLENTGALTWILKK